MATLAYCTNVHPSESLDELMRVVEGDAREVRRAANKEGLPIGLYLSAAACGELRSDRAALENLQGALHNSKLDCVTINGFPYGGFHDAVVKERVYEPDWSTPERLEYSLAIADVLVHLLPEGASSSISTVAGGARDGFEGVKIEAMTRSLARLAYRFYQIEEETGRRLVLSLEPEPFTFIERDREVFEFFREVLWRTGREFYAKQFGVTPTRAEELLRRYIGVCYDCCHQSLFFENAETFFKSAKSEELTVGKIQLSSALEIRDQEGLREISRFAEDRYLHQTVARIPSTRSQAVFKDLPEALSSLSANSEWDMARTHFHVPLFWDADASLGSTQQDLIKTIRAAKAAAITDCWEIETYTWNVLPKELRRELVGDGLAQGIAEEFEWVESQVKASEA